jgi:Secretion system C-terminal sorting domain
MKQKITLVFAVLFFSLVLSSYRNGAGGNGYDCTGAEGAGAGASGAACSGGGCHGSTTSLGVTVELDSAGTAVTSYHPGVAYTVKITGTNSTGSTLPKFGFQLATVTAASAGTSTAAQAGTWGTVTSPVQNTSTGSSGLNIPIIEQRSAITATSGTGGSGTTYTESISWTAPAAGTGSIMLYGVINAVNGDGNASSADKSQTATPVTITEAVSCPTVTVTISQSGHVLTATSTGATSYQWYLNGTVISGATSSTYTASTTGAYTCMATTAGGCSGTSSAYNFSTAGINELSLSDAIQVYPTLTENSVNVKVNASLGAISYTIYSLDGKVHGAGSIAAGTTAATIDLSTASAGLYIIRMEDQHSAVSFKVVKQ